MAPPSDKGARAASKDDVSTPVWRAVFDAVERPVGAASERWVQSDTFMDGFALAWRVHRRVDRELKRGLDMWLGAWRLSTRADVDRLSLQLAHVERQLRDVRRELERSAVPAPPARTNDPGTGSRRRPATTGRRPRGSGTR